MQVEIITFSQCQEQYHVESDFLNELIDQELLSLATADPEPAIPHSQLEDLRRYAEWHYDLDVNLAGIAMMQQMLQAVNQLKRRNQELQNQVQFYLSAPQQLLRAIDI